MSAVRQQQCTYEDDCSILYWWQMLLSHKSYTWTVVEETWIIGLHAVSTTIWWWELILELFGQKPDVGLLSGNIARHPVRDFGAGESEQMFPVETRLHVSGNLSALLQVLLGAKLISEHKLRMTGCAVHDTLHCKMIQQDFYIVFQQYLWSSTGSVLWCYNGYAEYHCM